MSLIITLLAEVEARQQAAGERQGIAPEELAARTLLERFEEVSLPSTRRGLTTADLLANPPSVVTGAGAYEALRPFIGVFDSSTEQDGAKSNDAGEGDQVSIQVSTKVTGFDKSKLS